METDDTVPIAKAHFVAIDVPKSNVNPAGETAADSAIFNRSGALRPPYDPNTLCMLYEHSNALRQNVDAYAVNIDGNGHRFEPTIDLESDDVEEIIRDAMLFDSIHENGDVAVGAPTEDEVSDRIDVLRAEMRVERQRLTTFFDFACVDEPFTTLRKKSRQDKEVMGNAYWEVLRNGEGQPAQFNYVPAFTIRLLPRDRTPVESVVKTKRSVLSVSEESTHRFFRRFVQVFEGSTVYFKEYGDTRTMSHKTGHYYPDIDAMLAAEEDARPGTELIHYAIHSSQSPYGVPRWTGTMISVLGSRQSEEVNQMYFDNKSVPPLAILVSGGRLSSSSTKKIEDFVKNRIQGKNNFHAVMVIEALPAGNEALDAANGRMKIEIVPLTMAQHNDALFQNYDERNIDKIGMQFRLPRMLRGDIRDFNRSTSESALEFAEMQVFAPERTDFDFVMNRKILPDLGIKFHSFVSNSPNIGNPIDLTDMITKLVAHSILTPEEARELAKGIFNRDFKRIDDVWAQIPPDLLKAGIVPSDGAIGFPTTGVGGVVAPGDGEQSKRERIGAQHRDVSKKRDLRLLARDLLKFREILDDEATSVRSAEIDAERSAANVELIQLQPDEFAELVGARDAS